MRRAAAAAACWAALLAGAASAAPLVAERIDERDAATRLIGGPDAIGGVGDWYLANDRIRVIVDDPGRRYGKLGHGGTIVDVGISGRSGDDQFARLFPIVNLDQRVFLGFDTIRAEVDPQGRFARLVVSGQGGMSSLPRGGLLARRLDLLVPESAELAKVQAEVEYRVQPGEPFVRLTTRLRNLGESPAPVFAYGDVWMRGGRSMRSFVGDTLRPERSPGFRHDGFDRSDMIGSGGSMATFTFVAAPGVAGFPPVSYGIFSPERAARGLRSFGVTGKHVNLVNAFTFDPPWEEIGVWRILRATREELAPGEEWVYERRLVAADGADVASVTDLIFPLLGVADGASGAEIAVLPAGQRAVVHVERAEDGAPVTEVALPRSGSAAARVVLAPGDYVLTVRTETGAPQRQPLRVEAGRFSEATVRVARPGFLRFAPAFSDGGPGRIILEGLGETPAPVFGAELLDFRVDGSPSPSGTETREIHFIGNAHDPERVAVAPGRYRLTATRGLLHEIGQVEVEVSGPGAVATVPPFDLRQAVLLQGIVSADLHVHAQASDDSQMSNEARLRSYVAELVDVMVSTDHDHVADFGPALDALDLRGRIRVRSGVEVTSSAPSPAAPWTIGHHNAWPVAHRPEAHRQGAPPSQDLSVAELYVLLRRDYGARVVQLNHALGGNGEVEDGYFLSHLGSAGEPFDPSRPIDRPPNSLLLERASDGHTRAVDFDAMEIMNGRRFRQYRALREVWYSLLRQGFRRTATGNSDTHGPDEAAGYPRNFVYMGEGERDDARFDAAVRDGRLFATTGPLIAAFQVNGARMGDLASAPDGKAEVRLAVAGAPWVPVEEVRLLVDGEVVRSWRDLESADQVMRLSTEETLALSRDAFVTLEAGAPLDVEQRAWVRERGGVYASLLAPGFVSQAVSNPIYVDVDGDGRFSAAVGSGPEQGDAMDRLVVIVGLVAVLAVVWLVLRRRAGLGP